MIVVQVSTQASEPALIEFACVYLRERGYAIAEPNEQWETPTAFHARLGMGKDSIGRALRRAGCPHVVLHRASGGTGRIVELLSNAAFDAFCRKNKKP